MWKKLAEIFSVRTLLIFGDFLLYALAVIMLYLVCSVGTNKFFWIFILILIAKDVLSYLVGKSHTEDRVIDFFLTSLNNAVKNEENIREGSVKKGGVNKPPTEPPPPPPKKQGGVK